MTYENNSSELQKEPFTPFRLHLVSGNTIDVRSAGMAFMLMNAVMVVRDPRTDRSEVGLYDIVALRNIERLQQLLPEELV